MFIVGTLQGKELWLLMILLRSKRSQLNCYSTSIFSVQELKTVVDVELERKLWRIEYP